MAIATVNPATGETVRTFEPQSEAEVEARLERAHRAAALWRGVPVGERARTVGRAGMILEREKESLARLITLEMGKLYTAAADEVSKCALTCRYYAEHAAAFVAPTIVEEAATARGFIAYEPLGVVLAIMPWNFPFWQVIRFAAPALAAGNVALLKHASNVPQCALALEDLFRRAGAPAGAFQSLLIDGPRALALIDDPRIAAVTLTGSEQAGRAVGAAAGRAIKKVVLELGGSDPFIVTPSADLDRAATSAAKARVINNGQSCIAAKRFVVCDAVYDRFVPRFVSAMAGLRVGDPMQPDVDVGPLATPAILNALADQVDRSVAAGARLLAGGKRIEGRGSFYAPTVLADVPPDAPAYAEELFGPVATLLRAADAADAIQIANQSRFGLGASVWTRDRDEAARFASELECGMVFVNGPVASDPRFPFGGIKHSGHGRELGEVGLREFVNVKAVRMTFGDG